MNLQDRRSDVVKHLAGTGGCQQVSALICHLWASSEPLYYSTGLINERVLNVMFLLVGTPT